jgi:hypothetical protein
MNVLEKYAANCGVKIKEPYISTSYFPLKDKPYIILDNRSKFSANAYDLFADVMPYIQPVLQREGIEIKSFEKDDKNLIEGASPYIGLFKKQESYLIKNTKLVVACDNVTNYFASGLGVPSIGLYAAYPAECTEPVWSDSHISIESNRDGNLPGYGVAESPKTINFIEPEKIADNIFKVLGLEDRVEHKTFYIGDLYPTKVVEIIPDFAPTTGFMENKALNVRMDYHFDEQILLHWLQKRKINLLTDKPINLNLLKYFKNNIVQLTVNINDSFTVEYLTAVKNIGINVEAFCEEEGRLADYRFNFFDFDVNESMFKKKEDLDEHLSSLTESTKFLSGKILLSEGKRYSCYEAKKAKKELTTQPELVYDTPDFWKELDHYRLINDVQKN